MSNETRTTFEIWLPFGLMLLLAAASMTTMLLILVWLAVGVGVLNIRRDRGPLPSYGREAYRKGFRSLILKNYHAFWWPSYLMPRSNEKSEEIRHADRPYSSRN